MKFKTWLDFASYLLKNKLDISDVEVEFPKKKMDESIQEPMNDDEIKPTNSSLVECVKILSLGDEPTISHEISDIPVNELHVSSFEVIKEACGAGNIQLNESKIFLNVCDMEGHTTTNMSISIDGQRFSNMPLSLVESEKEKIVLSDQWIKENIIK